MDLSHALDDVSAPDVDIPGILACDSDAQPIGKLGDTNVGYFVLGGKSTRACKWSLSRYFVPYVHNAEYLSRKFPVHKSGRYESAASSEEWQPARAEESYATRQATRSTNERPKESYGIRGYDECKAAGV